MSTLPEKNGEKTTLSVRKRYQIVGPIDLELYGTQQARVED